MNRRLRMVVASPSDVKEERNAIARVVEELQRGLAAEMNIQIELRRWETDAFPGFHADGPQGLIDPILRIEECDLLVGIFWKRFGTPTMGAGSGTAHEFETARAAWSRDGRPQIMVYFNKRPYSPASKREVDQWASVLEFKEKFPKEGLWWEYTGSGHFERLFRSHLTQFLRQGSATARALMSDPRDASTSGDQVVRRSIVEQVSIEIRNVVKAIVESELKIGARRRRGCQSLFSLYKAIRALENSSRQLISLISSADVCDNLDALAACHVAFSREVKDFSSAVTKCASQIGVYDVTLERNVRRLLGVKRQRVQFWSRAIEASAAGTGKCELLVIGPSNAGFEDPDFRDLDLLEPNSNRSGITSISLNDAAALRLVLEDSEDRIASLDLVAAELSEVIKSRCEFADLFDDVSDDAGEDI